MSKAPKNIEKILLGAGVAVGGALAVFGFLKLNGVGEDFSDEVGSLRDTPTAVKGAELVPGTINSLQSDRVYEAAEVPNNQLESGQRPVDLFIGVPLFASRDNPNQPVDLLLSDKIHAPIPNAWWLKHGADIRFADSLSRDDDGDGFVNLEEFESKTDPGSDGSHPALIAKLSFVSEVSVSWLMEFGFEAGGKWTPKISVQKPRESPVTNKVGFASGGLEVGDVFFEDKVFAKRFKFLGLEEREVKNERLNITEKIKFALYEDQRPNKKGWKYEVPNRMPRAQRVDWIRYDRTATLEMKAGPRGTLEIEENTRFGLPFDAEEKAYLLKEVTPDSVTVEWEQDGATRSVKIPKGGLPDLDR